MFSDNFDTDLEIITYIHDEIIDASGGIKGVHSEGLVRSALARPLQSVGGVDAYKTIYKKAAALLDSIANNHGFRDGNKRTAMAAASFFLDIHDTELSITNADYEEFMLHVVNDSPDIQEISNWLHSHSLPIPATAWELMDAHTMHKNYPETFEIPSPEDIEQLKIGSFVKLGFNPTSDADLLIERMWVSITARKEDKFTGTLEGDPVGIRGLKYGDIIHFSAENIFSIE